MKLPKQLGKPPLVDMVFEVRFEAQTPVASILPGVLLSDLKNLPKIERLPAADLPEQFRMSNPSLKYAPVIRASWDKYLILIGDRNLGLGCGANYPGWEVFKPAALKLFDLLFKSAVVTKVERYSFKSINVFFPEFGSASEIIDFQLSFGPNKLDKTLFHVRSEIVDNDKTINVVQLHSQGTVNFPDGTSRTGPMLDIDNIVHLDNKEIAQFFRELPDELERIHTRNKVLFFESLRPETLKKLEPVYD
jgi:uncharacterized protein (TIGR04255 family)